MKQSLYARIAAFVLAAVVASTAVGCGTGDENGASASDEAKKLEAQYTVEYQDAAENGSETSVVCAGTTATVSGGGVTAQGSVLTVSAGGTYRLSGTWAGEIRVEPTAKAEVVLLLDGITVASDTTAPLYIYGSSRTYLETVDGTVNTFSDTAGGETATESDDNAIPNATVYARDDLILCGSGTLHITGLGNNGITGRDSVQIQSGTVTVEAANHGIRATDSISIADGVVTITAGGDGIKTTEDSEEAEGFARIDGGTLTITAEQDGLSAATALLCNGGTVNITAGGGAANAAAHVGNDRGGFWNERGGSTASAVSDTISQKGMKGGTGVSVSGGTYTIDAADDAVHTNGTATVTGGTLILHTGDDGIHADTCLAIDGGDITIAQSYEGLESAAVTVSGGNISIVSSDDGINAADGTNPGGGFFGGGAAANATLTISGGTLTVNADGDGLDSNGSMTIQGGTVTVYGPTNSGNGALDSETSITVGGGTLLAVGAAGMAETPGSASTQYCVCYTVSAVSAGTTLTVSASDGTEVLSFETPKSLASVIFSSSALEKGETYTLTANGTVLGTVTVSTVVNTYGSAGGMGGGGMGGGGMGGGGMGGGGMGGGRRP